MSFFTPPVSSTSPATPVSPSSRTARASAPASTPAPDAVRVDTMPASPPDEVLDAIGVAAQAATALERSGRRLQFSADPPTGRVTAQVTDHSGTVLGSLTGAQVLALAGGEPLA
jgi:hypothetical protein